MPSSARPGLYKIIGAVKSLFGGDQPISGDSQVEVLSAGAGTGARSIAEAIAGSDKLIDDGEIMTAIQLWIKGEVVPGTGRTISDDEIMMLITYWIADIKVDQPLPRVAKQSLDEALEALLTRVQPSELNVQAFSARPNPARSSQLSFRVEGTGVESIQVEVYDLAGRSIFDSGFLPGRELGWDLLTADGKPVANGVYLYVITARGYDGQLVRSKVQKLVILR